MSGESEQFDPEWYVKRYPDVARSGLDPSYHYQWLGRRLGRLPGPSSRRVAVPESARGVTQTDDPYGNAAISDALKRLCAWLFPAGTREYRFTAAECYDAVAHNFWNDEANGTRVVNPNGALLVDFMRNFTPDQQSDRPSPRASRARPQSILLVSYYAPSRAHAGGLRILDLYEEIRERYPSVHLTLFCSRNPSVDGDLCVLDGVFDKILMCEPDDFAPHTLRGLLDGGNPYDVVDLQFHQAGRLADGFRAFGKFVTYTPMEVLSRADFDIVRKRSAEMDFPSDKFFSLVHHGAAEAEIMRSVDLTVCVSDADAAFLRSFAGKAQVTHFPTGLSRSEFAEQLRKDAKPTPISKRQKRLVFAAYFGSETNSAGLEWYLREVHPRVLGSCPDYNLAVVGRGDTSRLQRLGAASVSFIGEVPRLSPVLEQCRAGLVLALHGSGFRGKINQYALCGLPSVSTSLGATGLDYVDGKDILIADGPEAFAEKCIGLLTMESDTQRLADAARARALRCYTWDAIWPAIAPVYGLA